MSWDKTYSNQGNVWGDQPSELAVFAADFLSAAGAATSLEVLDIGCGYGRDAVYLSRRLGCSVTGIDNSAKAVSMALESCPADLKNEVQFRCADFVELTEPYHVIYASNLYQVLPKSERAKLADTIKRNLSPGGLLFLSTLSTHDPEEYGRGTPVEGDADSFEREKFLHFSTRAELESIFDFLSIERLLEHEYDEPHPGARTHHHISWILAARKPSNECTPTEDKR